MARTITISPVTRIEGHGRITIRLDDAGEVADARFHVTEFRGFEQFCLGRNYREMPVITARICGICPVSHALAAAKAGDAIKGVRIPPAAEKLRRLMHAAQFIQSHALNFFILSGPDLFLGMDGDPARRNLFGLMESMPGTVRRGIRLRQFGQEVIRLLGDRSVHPAWAVPGGVREPLSQEARDRIALGLPEAKETALEALRLGWEIIERFADDAAWCGNFPTPHLGLVAADGGLEHYDGTIRMVDRDGTPLEDRFPPDRYDEIIGERVESWSYLKFPVYRPREGDADGGVYRVGPLARLNVAGHAATPGAERELRRLRTLSGDGTPLQGSFYQHQARLVEILFCLETIEALLDDPEILDPHVRSHARTNNRRGVGVIEAPRGLLIHDYQVDETGLLERVNLIVATGHNNLAMNRTVLQIARRHLSGARLDEGLLNRVAHGIRCYDPCLSCSTHAAGPMGLVVELYDPRGNLLQRAGR